MQVYAPTTYPKFEDIEPFYADLQQTFDQAPAKDILFIAGDFNAKVGAGNEIPVVGKFGLGERKCCQENRLLIANTWFEQPNCHLTAPNRQYRNQIDYFKVGGAQ